MNRRSHYLSKTKWNHDQVKKDNNNIKYKRSTKETKESKIGTRKSNKLQRLEWRLPQF